MLIAMTNLHRVSSPLRLLNTGRKINSLRHELTVRMQRRGNRLPYFAAARSNIALATRIRNLTVLLVQSLHSCRSAEFPRRRSSPVARPNTAATTIQSVISGA